jgi:predicted O-methyltransferase YrrM
MAGFTRRARRRLARALAPDLERELADLRVELDSTGSHLEMLGAEHHRVSDERDKAIEQLERFTQNPFLTWRPPGHFYSPVPDPDEVHGDLAGERRSDPDIEGITVRADAQRALFGELAPLIDLDLVLGEAGEAPRYRPVNGSFDLLDAAIATGMVRWLKPSRLIEVGSGFSSALLLDTAGRHRLDVRFTFIEPYMDTLRSTLRSEDADQVTLIEERVQDVDLDVFGELDAGDVLFIDSSHVVKPGSDAVHLYAEVMPRLAPGVVIHVHDIFHPFEYPPEWIAEGRAWNEAYLLRAMLSGGDDFEILFFNDWFRRFEQSRLEAVEPRLGLHTGGSLWMRKVR